MKILVIEDDPTLNRNISEALQSEGFVIDNVYDGLLAEKLLKKRPYDAVILDINIPGKTGFDICRDFRTHNNHTPVLMLTAFDELEDKVKGFDVGADDYLTKPFFMRELVLRVNAILKRTRASENHTMPTPIVTVGDIVIHTSKKTVNRSGQPVNLSSREYHILLRLCQTPGEVVSKKELISEIWGSSFDTNTNTIEVYINFLRNKLDKPFGKSSIKTKVGFGYYLDFEE